MQQDNRLQREQQVPKAWEGKACAEWGDAERPGGWGLGAGRGKDIGSFHGKPSRALSLQ